MRTHLFKGQNTVDWSCLVNPSFAPITSFALWLPRTVATALSFLPHHKTHSLDLFFPHTQNLGRLQFPVSLSSPARTERRKKNTLGEKEKRNAGDSGEDVLRMREARERERENANGVAAAAIRRAGVRLVLCVRFSMLL